MRQWGTDVYKRQDEFGFGTAEIFRHGDAGIVGARNADTFDHGLYGLGPVSYTHLDVYKRQD